MNSGFEQGFKKLVDDNVARGEARDVEVIAKKVSRRRPLNFVAATLVVVLAATSTVAVGQWIGGAEISSRDERVGGGNAAAPSAEMPSCRNSESGSFARWTTEAGLIAWGFHADKAWSLCSRLAEVTDPNLDAPRHGVCMEWVFDGDPGSGMDCTLTRLSPGYFQALPGFGNALYGAVPEETESAVFQPAIGAAASLNLYDPPPELGVQFKFFVVFAYTGAGGTITARDEGGDVIGAWPVITGRDQVTSVPDWASDSPLKHHRGALTEPLRGKGDAGESEETDFTIEGSPAAWLLNACASEAPPTTPLHCRAIRAVANGTLDPGSYSDAELRKRLGE